MARLPSPKGTMSVIHAKQWERTHVRRTARIHRLEAEIARLAEMTQALREQVEAIKRLSREGE